jgi:hypothetical protein
MTFWSLSKQRYLAAGKHKTGYKIVKAGSWWCLYHLANIDNEQSGEELNRFWRLNEAKAFARMHNAAQPSDPSDEGGL